MDTISRDNNSSTCVAGVIVGLLALVLSAVAVGESLCCQQDPSPSTTSKSRKSTP